MIQIHPGNKFNKIKVKPQIKILIIIINNNNKNNNN